MFKRLCFAICICCLAAGACFSEEPVTNSAASSSTSVSQTSAGTEHAQKPKPKKNVKRHHKKVKKDNKNK